ncbi:MAG: SUMF1/EgtB/PvdO family nonheme iron enzyme [Hyphomonadaceae bacterium]|nr:SUMF1/EgtB/PvdO family nonheme iron enzyme [Hyphomonadaceae bacterium]
MRRALLALSLLCVFACAKPENPARDTLPKMILIPAGEFTMGAPPEEDTQQGKPQHRVTVRAFRIGETEVTFDQYDAFARATGRALPQDEGFGRGERPVMNIDRSDMLAYIDWLNAQSGQKGYRLPSEAEWEYAARAGTTTPFFWGTAPDPRYGNSAANTGPDTFAATAPARSFQPNAWGLYDTAGNVWEMVQDCMHHDFVGAPTDGSAWMDATCYAYMLRGGEYQSMRRGTKTTSRSAMGGSYASMGVGFRIAQDVE